MSGLQRNEIYRVEGDAIIIRDGWQVTIDGVTYGSTGSSFWERNDLVELLCKGVIFLSFVTVCLATVALMLATLEMVP